MESGNQRKARGKGIPFEEIVRRFEEYKSEHGHMYIPNSYVTKDGFNLGSMVNSIRTGNRKVTPEQKRILNDMGFIWSAKDVKKLPLYYRPPMYSFEEIFDELIKYKEKKGDLLVPQKYIAESGMKLGHIVCCYRNGTKQLSIEQMSKLNDIGFVWRIRRPYIPMNIVIDLFIKYKKEYGNLQIPFRYVTSDNIRLGNIAYNIKKGNRKVSEKERHLLIAMGFKFYD